MSECKYSFFNEYLRGQIWVAGQVPSGFGGSMNVEGPCVSVTFVIVIVQKILICLLIPVRVRVHPVYWQPPHTAVGPVHAHELHGAQSVLSKGRHKHARSVSSSESIPVCSKLSSMPTDIHTFIISWITRDLYARSISSCEIFPPLLIAIH